LWPIRLERLMGSRLIVETIFPIGEDGPSVEGDARVLEQFSEIISENCTDHGLRRDRGAYASPHVLFGVSPNRVFPARRSGSRRTRTRGLPPKLQPANISETCYENALAEVTRLVWFL
jgi:hypothetical protein